LVLKPNHWNISLIRDFILLTGPVSSMSEFLTFFVRLRAFHASEQLFHTGWFVESLATETLVLPIIRTAANPFRNRPNLPLVITVLAVVAVGLGLPFSPLAGILGFTPLPLGFFGVLAAVTIMSFGIPAGVGDAAATQDDPAADSAGQAHPRPREDPFHPTSRTRSSPSRSSRRARHRVGCPDQ
jgi:magnesium-transporting ATPase (P-type)